MHIHKHSFSQNPRQPPHQGLTSAPDQRDPKMTAERFANTLLESVGIGGGRQVTLRIADRTEFNTENEHFALRSDGTILLRDTFYEKVKNNITLLSCIVGHELYHNVRQGMVSYQQAIGLIRSFSISDIIRADLADRITYRALSRNFDLSFDEYCDKVMLEYPNLFGAGNKDFADFTRFASKLFTLKGMIGNLILPEGVVMLAPHESGWRQGDDKTKIDCQLITDRVSFATIELPNEIVGGLKAIFGIGNATEAANADVSASPNEVARRAVKVGIMIEAVRAAEFRREK